MKKIISSVFLFFLLLFTSIIFSPIIQAEENKPPGFSWVCLNYCSLDPGANQCSEPNLTELKNTQPGNRQDGFALSHRVFLTGEGFPSNQDVYIVGCIETSDGIKCTTGKDEYDNYLKIDRYSNLQNIYTFIVDGDPKKTPSGDGRLKAIAVSATPTGTKHRFFGVYPVTTEIIEGKGATLQYGTFQGEQEIEKCAFVHWDPEGRIFDSLSLEPIPNISISILSSPSNKPVSIPNNPQITKADGQFNFFVEPGNYILDLIVPSNYKFTDNPKIHPNYNKAYYNLYKPNTVIIEKEGVVEHRDIPLEPIDTPLRTDPVIMTWGQISSNTETEYSGNVSHPLSIITLFTSNTNKQLGEPVSANKYGQWRIILNNNNIPADEQVYPKVTKIDLTTLSQNPQRGIIENLISKLFKRLSKSTSAQTLKEAPKQQKQTVKFSPILHYLEGYAYDEKGEIIPKAKVKVKLKMSDGVYYQTTADEKGYFVILPQNLPIFEYYLQYETPTKTVKQTTDQFAKNNKQYLAANKINLMTATKNNQPVISPTITQKITISPYPTKSSFQQSSSSSLSSPTSSPLPNQSNVNSNTIYFLVGLSILGLIITGGVFFYLKKKSSQL